MTPSSLSLCHDYGCSLPSGRVYVVIILCICFDLTNNYSLVSGSLTVNFIAGSQLRDDVLQNTNYIPTGSSPMVQETRPQADPASMRSWSVVYYESMKRELKTRPIYECWCEERLKTKAEESTCLTYTGLLGELEHLKIGTRLIDEMFASVMGEYVFLK